jgi:hypothetical protein
MKCMGATQYSCIEKLVLEQLCGAGCGWLQRRLVQRRINGGSWFVDGGGLAAACAAAAGLASGQNWAYQLALPKRYEVGASI